MAVAAALLAVLPNYAADSDVSFTRITEGDIVNTPGSSWGCAWGDYDGDGYPDLVVANGAPTLSNHFYRNNGDGTFARILEGNLIATDADGSSSAVWADDDNDGNLDLFVGNGAEDTATDALYHNEGNDNAWLQVRPVGTVSNRSALGAKVRICATVWGNTVGQIREIATGDGWTGQSDLRAHFGLGDATNVTTLRIEWPSGIVQEFQNVPAKQFLTITEPPQLVPLGPIEFQIRCWKGMQFEVKKSHDLQTWDSMGTVTNETGTLIFQDTQGDPQSAACFYRVVSW